MNKPTHKCGSKSCPWCLEDRLHKHHKRMTDYRQDLTEYRNEVKMLQNGLRNVMVAGWFMTRLILEAYKKAGEPYGEYGVIRWLKEQITEANNGRT